MPLTLWGNPILDHSAVPLSDDGFNAEFRDLCERMLRVMHAAQGVGLAAPQVGISKRFFVYDCDGSRGVIANPAIVERSRDLQDDREGCLSVPGFRWPTVRADGVTVTGLDHDGEPVCLTAKGYLARCFQHEIDHLDGRLYLSRLGGSTARRARSAARAATWFGQPSRFIPVTI